MKAPKKLIAGCETCEHCQGEPFEDEEIKDLIRIYCTARHTSVDLAMMNKYCDFWTVKENIEI